MPYVTTDDSVKLYYEDTGTGTPIVFVHEFAGDHRSWEPQVRYFSRLYRCITFAARGYLPSDIPGDLEMYSQGRATDDIAAVISGLGLQSAHVVGLSMGAYATLHLGIRRPKLVRLSCARPQAVRWRPTSMRTCPLGGPIHLVARR